MGSAAQWFLVPAMYSTSPLLLLFLLLLLLLLLMFLEKFDSFWKVPIPAPDEILRPIIVWLRVPIFNLASSDFQRRERLFNLLVSKP